MVEDCLGMPGKIAVLGKDSHRRLQGIVSSGAGALQHFGKSGMLPCLCEKFHLNPGRVFPCRNPVMNS